jgi:hypothetical protein
MRLMTSTHCCLNASCRRLLCLYSAVRPDVSSADKEAPSSEGSTTGVGVGVGVAAADATAAGGIDDEGTAAAGEAAAPACEDAAPPAGCCTPLGGSMSAVVAAAADPVAAWGRAAEGEGRTIPGRRQRTSSLCTVPTQVSTRSERAGVSPLCRLSSLCRCACPSFPFLSFPSPCPLDRTAETHALWTANAAAATRLPPPPVLQACARGAPNKRTTQGGSRSARAQPMDIRGRSRCGERTKIGPCALPPRPMTWLRSAQ